jgi:hypothetical protein
MSPTVRHNLAAFELDAVSPARVPTRARRYAIAVLVAALALVAALWIGGAALPEPGLLLVLALPLALCMNRYLFFPNEVGVTADAAVIFAAMVAFRGDAQWLGPLVLALLAGPLDARHWGARAFTRMAYNSGSTALVAAAALAVFVPLEGTLGSGWQATLAAAAIAALPYFVAESILGITLVTALGERPADAARHQLPLNAIVVPLAVVGAAAGIAAMGVGWWLCLLLLLPVPLAPEAALVVLPRRIGARAAVDLGLAIVGIALLGSSIAVDRDPVNLVVGLLGLAMLVLVENPPRRATPLPPLAVVLVVIPVAVLSTSPPEAGLVAGATGAAYLCLAARFERRWRWSLPLVVFVAALGSIAKPGSVALVSTGVVVGVILAAAWGPLPWSSRVAGRLAAAYGGVRVPTLVLVVVGVPAVSAVAVLTHGTIRTAAAAGAEALVEFGVFSVALGVRLWRFAPRRRTTDLVVLTMTGIVALVLSLPSAYDAGALVVLGAVACSAAIAYVAWPLSRLRSDLKELDVAHRQ